MKTTFAQYEHSTIGFPHVKLKWFEENGKWSEGYVTKLLVIETPWIWKHSHHFSSQNISEELKRFDDYVRARFSKDASVQG